MIIKLQKKKKSSKEMKNDYQLIVYALFLIHEGIAIKGKDKLKIVPEKLALLSLRHEDVEESIKFELDELIDKKNDIEKIAEDIRENKFSSNVGHHCEYCEFKDLICPEFN